MKAYKALDQNFKCRDFQYEVGKTYKIDGELKLCGNGFHACQNPLDVLEFYDLTQSRFAEVEQTGKTLTEDTKTVSEEITITKELSLAEFIKVCVKYQKDAASGDGGNLAASGYSSKLAASGDGGNLAASGYSSKLAASGDYSKLAASGNYSNLAASGYGSNLAASGDWSNLAASGGYSNLAASGDGGNLAASGGYSKLAASGDGSNLAASGYSSNLAASGGYSNLAASGGYSKLAASGDYSKLATSGDGSKLAASGENSVIMAAGLNSRVKLGKNGIAALVYIINGEYNIKVIKEGKQSIEADTWYSINDKGEVIVC